MSRGDRPGPARERTAEDRERDRQMRARRRPLRGSDDGLASTKARPDGPRAVRSGPGWRPSRARVGALLALAAAAFCVWFLVSLIQPFAGPGSGRVIVVIPKGASSSKIGSILARDGVVPSGFFFELRALLEGKRGSLRSGRFQLRRNMSYAGAIDALTKPPPPAIIVRITIPEGYTRLQIGRLADADGLSGSYLTASARSPLLDPARYGAPRGMANLEGFLFPATYEIDAGAPASELVAAQLAAFGQRFGPAEAARARALRLSPYGLLTVASMIEREAQTQRDRPLIAAVIYNRLRRGMPLGIDATLVYALELKTHEPPGTNELTEAQLHMNSPYNTRLHTGLPPTPIANPGMASIEAAAHPAHARYLYYVAAADGCGEHVFSSTYADFQTHVAAYRAALAHNGGRPPVCKRE